MNTTTTKLYQQFRQVGMNAQQALRSAKTVSRFNELEAQDLVRMGAEHEQESYWDVYGKPDTEKERKETERILELYGCFCTFSQYRDENGQWQTADSCGMNTGYKNVLNPLENWIIVDEMATAIDQIDNQAVAFIA